MGQSYALFVFGFASYIEVVLGGPPHYIRIRRVLENQRNCAHCIYEWEIDSPGDSTESVLPLSLYAVPFSYCFDLCILRQSGGLLGQCHLLHYLHYATTTLLLEVL